MLLYPVVFRSEQHKQHKQQRPRSASLPAATAVDVPPPTHCPLLAQYDGRFGSSNSRWLESQGKQKTGGADVAAIKRFNSFEDLLLGAQALMAAARTLISLVPARPLWVVCVTHQVPSVGHSSTEVVAFRCTEDCCRRVLASTPSASHAWAVPDERASAALLRQALVGLEAMGHCAGNHVKLNIM